MIAFLHDRDIPIKAPGKSIRILRTEVRQKITSFKSNPRGGHTAGSHLHLPSYVPPHDTKTIRFSQIFATFHTDAVNIQQGTVLEVRVSIQTTVLPHDSRNVVVIPQEHVIVLKVGNEPN